MQECNPQNTLIQADPASRRSTQASPPAVQGLYLHVPFCFHKCHYCDFYSIVEPKDKPDRQEAFTDALIAELNQAAKTHRLTPMTLFVGGGTPTLLRPELWAKLLDALHSLGVMDQVTEFTVEANPETVTAELMAVLTGGAGENGGPGGGSGGGVNRVSLGAQSFNLDQLKTLERWHDPQTVPKAVRLVRDAGIDNFNLDLIFAIPGQTLDLLDQDLDAALALEPTHLSCYSLIFEPNTPLTQKMKLGRISPVGEDLEGQMYDHVIRRLDDAGFEHYEISNWAKRPASAVNPQPPNPQPPIPNSASTTWSTGPTKTGWGWAPPPRATSTASVGRISPTLAGTWRVHPTRRRSITSNCRCAKASGNRSCSGCGCVRD